MSLDAPLRNGAEEIITSGAQRQQLIVTLFGLYGRRFDDYLPIADIIELMSDLGMESSAVRSVISRLKRQNVLVSGRANGQAAYALAPEMEQVFAEGDQRIINTQRANVVDPWLLVSFSVPEAQRNLRHQLRKLLSSFGFWAVMSGLWIAPLHLEDELVRELQRRDFSQFTKLFRASVVGDEDMSANVRQWWDLDSIACSYSEFIDNYSPPIPHDDAEHRRAFANYLSLVTDWRRLPYLDPGLPLEYLPAEWLGLTAEELFFDRQNALHGDAASRVEAVLGRTR